MTPKPTAEEKVIRTDNAMDRLAELVTAYGPKFLVRGMPAYQAHEAMVACLEKLVAEVERLRPHAEFGVQCYQDRCENAYVESSVLKAVEVKLGHMRRALGDIEMAPRILHQDNLVEKMQALARTALREEKP